MAWQTTRSQFFGTDYMSDHQANENQQGGQLQDGSEFKIWMCIICGWMYEEEKGAPEEGIAPGTRWEDVPDDWFCPDCGAGKEDFEMIEV
jgi:rubredoxin